MNRFPSFLRVAVFVALASSALAALDPGQPPSGNFNLANWKLTLPTGPAEDPDEILPAQLNNGYTNSPYFFTASDGAMRFWTPVTGVTTGGSSYPRTELREQMQPGSDTPNWFANGTHVLSAQCKIVQVPSTGKLIIGQIHGKFAPDGSDANPLVKLAYDYASRSIRMQVKTSPYKTDSSESVDVVSGIELNTLITYEIRVIDGVVHNTVNGTTRSRDFYATDPDWAGTDLYFKAGSYCQDNSGPNTEGSKVDFYALALSHSGVPPTITTTALPSGRTTISYGNQQLAASGGTTPFTWSLASGTLPAGLSLAASTGIVSGTPTTAGTSNFTVRVTDASSQTDTQALAITINANSVPNITTTTLPPATIGAGYSQSIASSGGDAALAWSVSSGALPAGLALSNVNSQNATISGTPTTAGTANFTLRLADVDADADTQALSIVVNAPPPADPEIVPVASPDGTPWDIAGSNGPDNLWDGDTADGTNGSRWASNASPGTLSGSPRYVVLDLGATYNVSKFILYPYQSRAYHHELYVSDSITNWGAAVVNVQPASGAASYTHTLGTAAVGRYVKLVVDGISGTSTTWASINELNIYGTAAGGGTVATPTFSPGGGSYGSAQTVTIATTTSGATIRYTTDGSTPSQTNGTVYSSAVTISTNTTLKAIAYKSGMTDSAVATATYTIDSSPVKFTIPGTSVVASADDGNVAANTVDGSLSTRWSAQGDGQWIRYDLGSTKTVKLVKIAWHQGNTRTSTFDVQVSSSATGPWTTLLANQVSSGTTTALETYDVTDTAARYVRIVGHGNSTGNGWNSITETEVWGN